MIAGLQKNQTLLQIRQSVDKRFADIGKATPTPMPPG